MVSEPTLVGPKSMASASPSKMFPLKYSCEEIYERMDKGLCIFCEELDTPGHHDSKHKRVRIVMTECDEDQVFEDKEEAHQETVTNPNPSVETVTNPESLVETLKNSGPFIESLKRASVLQVPDSFFDVLLVHKLDSHVKEVEELSQESTNGNEKNVAHQVFDKMPPALTSKEKRRKSLKAWKFKFKISFKRSKLMDDMFSFVEETAWLNRDPKETIWDYVKKEFKGTMAACGKKTIDRSKLVDETSKPAVYDGPIQIRVRESGGSPLERVDEKSSGGVKFHLKHKWRSRVLQTLSGWKFCLLPAKFDLRDWPKEESKPHQKKPHQIETFEVLSSLEPSRRSHNEQLGVSDNFPFAIVRTHISHSQSDLKCVTGNAHRMFDVMPLETKPLKNKRKKALQKTWWFKFKTSLERSKLMDAKLSFMEELGAQQGLNMEVWSGFDLEACIGFVTYGWEYEKQINTGHVSLNGMCNELVYDEEKKKLRNVKPAGCLCDLDQVNSLDEEEFVGFTEFSKLQLAMEFLLLNSGIFMNTRLLHDKINSVFVTLRVALTLLVVSEHNKAIRTRYEKAKKVNKHKINFTGKFAESIIVAVIDEHEETACVLLQMSLNGGTQTLSHLVKNYDDRRRITWFKLTINSVSQQTTGSAPQSDEVQGETNWNDVTQTEAVWGAKHTSLGYVENSLAEFRAYEVYHPPRPPELPRYKEDEESTAIGSISAIVGENEAKAQKFSSLRTRMFSTRFYSSSCVLQQEDNYVRVLFPVAGTADISIDELRSVCKLLFGIFVLNLITEQVRDWSFFGLLLQWKWHPPPQATSEFHQAHNDKPVFHL